MHLVHDHREPPSEFSVRAITGNFCGVVMMIGAALPSNAARTERLDSGVINISRLNT